MPFEQISSGMILFFILYGITGAVPAIAAIYLLLRRGNAFVPGVTPPVRLRRWAASFFAISALSHVWWLLFYLYSRDLHSLSYFAIVLLDCVLLLTTIAGTQLAMLQDRRRPVWPVLVVQIPFVMLGGVCMVYPNDTLEQITTAYILLAYLCFNAYMVIAVMRYGRWLRDNYADLENKKVWLSQVVAFFCMLLLVIYMIAADELLICILHFVALALVVLLLWRVETLPQLDSVQAEEEQQQEEVSPQTAVEPSTTTPMPSNIRQLLAERCVDSKLFLQHDLSMQQLAATLGTNRTYLGMYFSSQGINYNAYINGLRINHFITLYHEAVANEKPFTVQQLASESGYRSYSTFSLAFKQRMGQTVTAWMQR